MNEAGEEKELGLSEKRMNTLFISALSNKELHLKYCGIYESLKYSLLEEAFVPKSHKGIVNFFNSLSFLACKGERIKKGEEFIVFSLDREAFRESDIFKKLALEQAAVMEAHANQLRADIDRVLADAVALRQMANMSVERPLVSRQETLL